MRELTVTEKDCAQQLIKYLSKYMEEAPKSFFYKMLRKKNIVLNGKKCDGSEKLAEGDTATKEKRYQQIYTVLRDKLLTMSPQEAKQEITNNPIYSSYLSKPYYYKLFDEFGR